MVRRVVDLGTANTIWPSLSDLKQASRLFLAHEPRDLFYGAATDLVAIAPRGKSSVTLSDALAVLLQTWNHTHLSVSSDHASRLSRLWTAKGRSELQQVHSGQDLMLSRTDGGDRPVRIAFNFEESAVQTDFWSTQLYLEQLVLGLLVEVVPKHRRHFRVRSGLVPGHLVAGVPDARKPEVHKALLFSLLTAEGRGTWSTVTQASSYQRALIQNDMLAIVVEGVSYHDSSRVETNLREVGGYLGALQVQPQSEAHFYFYLEPLPYRYRLYEDSLRLLHGAEQNPELTGQDNRDHGWRESIASYLGAHGIDDVDFQDMGLLDTIFDPYRGQGHAEAAGRTEALLVAYHGAMVDDLLIRLREADPQLIEALDAAFSALDSYDSVEQLSHVAVSCRRFLERLADVVYPPRDEPVDGRKLGKTQYRNRLWRYAQDRLNADSKATVVLASLEHIGGRIEALDKAANKGVHDDVEVIEMHRLVMGLFLLAHDLLTLRAPDGRAVPSYAGKLEDEMFRAIKETSPGSNP